MTTTRTRSATGRVAVLPMTGGATAARMATALLTAARLTAARLTAARMATALLTAALLTAACSGGSGDGDDGPAAIDAPAGLSVSVLQYRSDYTIRLIQIKVTNQGRAPVTVTAARLSSPALKGPAAWLGRTTSDEVVITPGTATDLQAQLPDVECSTGDVRGSVRLDLRAADGSLGRTGILPVGDPFGTLANVHSQDCRREAALAIADIEVTGPVRTVRRAGTLIGLVDLRLAPSGRAGRVTVETIAPTTLLRPESGGTWEVHRTVGAGSGPQTVTLPLQAARCDPHAIAEDKLGTVLPVTLRVDDGEPGVVTVAADAELRGQIQQFVHQACTG